METKEKYLETLAASRKKMAQLLIDAETKTPGTVENLWTGVNMAGGLFHPSIRELLVLGLMVNTADAGLIEKVVPNG